PPPWPAVVLVHGAGGVIGARERTYARQFAAMGVAALVIDAFAARRDLATGFTARLLAITETMLLADAYAGLDYLAARDDIDGGRVALIGFSYGAMASVFGAYAVTADRLAPDGPRFAAHVAFYGPCIARFAEPRTTGAPVLMLAGTEDAIVDRARCEQVADDLRAGGSTVETVWYDGAWHQWDGAFRGPRPIGRNLARCSLRVGADGGVTDLRTGLPMAGPLTRRLILGLCVEDQGYLIGRDDGVRARSNAALGAFLAEAL
ncbi:MAG: dienelactone hydrolase, partial [Alphaproteobacteria bacterium]|nr:dienelactone hydrolase [Alphaproteobacteria bacterium]